MAEEFHSSGWWDTPRSRYEPGTATAAAVVSSSTSSSSSGLTSLRGFGWLGDVSGGRSVTVSAAGGGGPVSFLDPLKMHVQGHSSAVLADGGGVGMADPSLHMMNLGLSSQPMDWDGHNLMSGDKSETGFRAMLQENLNMNAAPAGTSSHHQIQSGFQIDSPSIYGASPPSSLFQGILGSENQSSAIGYQYSPTYDQNSGELLPSWSKVPQFLRISPPEHQQQADAASHNQLHFSNNAPFWNATAASPAVSNIRSTSCYFPSPQSSQFSTSSLEEKAKKNLPEATRNVTSAAPAATGKKSGTSETTGKRGRGGGGETATALPPFKVRKEKMGDRITALQQLVSPFGKTDTASVLTEAIDYIKFLHEQVSILSTPYMKSGGVLQHHQDMDKCDELERPRQDLRSRGLCLVPVSSTFPVAHEAAVDFWNPSFGGTFR